MSKNQFEIPAQISHVSETLKNAGFEAHLIGGCTRDMLIGRKPKDWDYTTNATPEEIMKLFPETFYENEYGTVGVVNKDIPMGEDGLPDESLKVVEVTPYRIESEYSDKRRPDSVSFSKDIKDDLKRRDFTINAIAFDIKPTDKKDIFEAIILDIYEGQKDIKNKIIRTVGEPKERFSEDALRLMRAVRISAELGFEIEEQTKKAIIESAGHLKEIAGERIREEFIRIIMSDRPKEGLELAHELGILKYVVPELEDGIGVKQNQAHAYDVWTHLLKTVAHSAKKNFPLEVRLTALFHDIGKPKARRFSDEKRDYTFYGHDVVGARIAEKILTRLKFSKKDIETIGKLCRWHMFFSDTEQITLSAVRRMIRNVGQENIWNLMNVRICDRIGTGRPKESPYRLRKYNSMIEEALRDPVTVQMLKIDGAIIMKETKITPGPKIGWVLHALLEEVLEKPELNTEEYLVKRAVELVNLPENELKRLGTEAKEKKEELEEKEIKEIRGKYWVS